VGGTDGGKKADHGGKKEGQRYLAPKRRMKPLCASEKGGPLANGEEKKKSQEEKKKRMGGKRKARTDFVK